MRLRPKLWVLITVTVVVGGGGFWFYQSNQGDKPTFRTAGAERGKIVSTVSATGTVVPVVQVAVGSQVSGTIASLNADYNDFVKQGQILAQLEPSLFRSTVVQAEANVERAKAALRQSDRTYVRAQELEKQGAIPEIELEVAQSAFEQRQAELSQAEANLQIAKVNLGHTTIRSPISGVVISRKVDVGQTVAASLQAPILYTIAQDLTKMHIESKIDEADVGQMVEGLEVMFTVDAYPDRRFRGKVTQVRLEPIVDDNVVTYATVIEVNNSERKLRPGMTANVTIVIAEKNDVLKIPNAALRFRPPQGLGEAALAGRGGSAGGRSREGGPGSALASQSGGQRGAKPGEEKRGSGPGETKSGSGSGEGRRAGPPPKRVFVLKQTGELVPVMVRTGITDGAFTEIVDGDLSPEDLIVVGLDTSGGRSNLRPPPGLGRRRR